MDAFSINGEILAALFTLTALEIVLGIDNIVFISILSGKLPARQQAQARVLGLGLAMVSRIALLFSLVWVMSLTKPLFAVMAHDFSGRDLILLGGGLFLVAKSTKEIHERVQEVEIDATGAGSGKGRKQPNFMSVLVQIMILDIIFSLDSVITAVGMANQTWVMVTAIVIAVLVMMAFSNLISRFIHEHPPVKVLALAFLLMVGVLLMAEGFGQHIPKGYIYAAMAFSIFVEFLNMRMATRKPPAVLEDVPEEALTR